MEREQRGLCPRCSLRFIFNASRRGAGPQFTSSTVERSPFPSGERTKTRSKVGETANVELPRFFQAYAGSPCFEVTNCDLKDIRIFAIIT